MKKNSEKLNEIKGSKSLDAENKPQQSTSAFSNLFKRIESRRKYAL
ncbi:MAG: hypothetical protein ACKVQB_10265 [Bacteroidia bacterium]